MNHNEPLETIHNSGEVTDNPLDIYERILPLGTDREMLVELLDDVFYTDFLTLIEAGIRYNDTKRVCATLTEFMDELCEVGLTNYTVDQVVDVILAEDRKIHNNIATLY